MLLQRSESLRRRRGTVHGAPQYFGALAVFDVVEPVRQLKYLLAVGALYPDLVYYVVQVAILFFRHEWRLALTALGATLRQPLFDALLVEDLFAVSTLNCPVRDAQANRANKWVDKSAIGLLHVVFAKSVGLIQHILNQMLIDSFYELLSICNVIFLEPGHSKSCRS